MTEEPFIDDPDATANLLKRAKNGDQRSIERLFEKCRPHLVAFAHGRLPFYQRNVSDTDDLVQNTLTRALNRLKDFENRRPGAFLAYLRTILVNEIRQEARKTKRARVDSAPADDHLDPGETPSTVAERRETFERYERALAQLTELQREAVVMRVDFALSYQEIAAATGKTTPGAAHMFVSRAVAKVARSMRDDAGRANERSG